MKKGFTMIELIFVIVILGILAAVAVPRLAATREDAQIAAAVANLRTLVSDVNSYYTTKGQFGTGEKGKNIGTKWTEMTNVPLKNADKSATDNDGILTIGGVDCIRVRLADRTAATEEKASIPASIFILKDKENKKTGLCKEVVDSEPLKPYFESRLEGVNVVADRGVISIGSSERVY